jgi:hypothetical protein
MLAWGHFNGRKRALPNTVSIPFFPQPPDLTPAPRGTEMAIRRLVELGLKVKGNDLPVNKVTWPQVGRVIEPGRYMYTFGWLTITAEDLAIWETYPDAAFTLVPKGASESGEEFALGSFDLAPSEK